MCVGQGVIVWISINNRLDTLDCSTAHLVLCMDVPVGAHLPSVGFCADIDLYNSLGVVQM